MSEHGYGAPTAGGPAAAPGYLSVEFDYGYGDPSAVTGYDFIALGATDHGYGSPVQIILLNVTGGLIAGDDGGEIFSLTANWPHTGPFQVYLVGADGVETPCYGITPGEGVTYADAYIDAQDRLKFAVPPTALGTYTVRVKWLQSGQQQSDVIDGGLIVYRDRHNERYSMRRLFPPEVYDVGPGMVGLEEVLGA